MYQETHSGTTTADGLIQFLIGDGTVSTGNITTINWGSDNYYLEVEVDIAGGTAYTSMGTSQFVSVPYALRAKYAENVNSSLWDDDSSNKHSYNEKLQKLEAENEVLKKELQNVNEKLNAILNKLAKSKD